MVVQPTVSSTAVMQFSSRYGCGRIQTTMASLNRVSFTHCLNSVYMQSALTIRNRAETTRTEISSVIAQKYTTCGARMSADGLGTYSSRVTSNVQPERASGLEDIAGNEQSQLQLQVCG